MVEKRGRVAPDGRCYAAVMTASAITSSIEWVEELAAEILKQADGGRGVDQTPPAAAGPVQHRPHQREAGPLAGEAADHLGPPAGLPEGPLEQVGVADPLPVLGLGTGDER